jgi:hypothetical protein
MGDFCFRWYEILVVRKREGCYPLGKILDKSDPNKEGGHTPCQDFYGRQLFVMYVELLRKSMHLSGRGIIGRPLERR